MVGVTTSSGLKIKFNSRSRGVINGVSPVSFGGKDNEISTSENLPQALSSVFVQMSSKLVRDGSIFLTRDPQQKVEWRDSSAIEFFC